MSSHEARHEARLAELNKRISEIDSAISQLDDEYAGVAAAFNTADKETLRQAEQIEQKVAWLRRERALAVAAGNRVVADAKTEATQREHEARHALLGEAKQISNAICTLNSELDEHLVKLRQLFERRAALFHELGSTGLLDSAAVNKLSGRAAATRAFCATGLHAYVSVEKVAQGSFVPLASTNAILLGIGRDRPDGSADLTEIVKSNGGAPPAQQGKIFGAGAEADEVADD
jgi:hypothetical protein